MECFFSIVGVIRYFIYYYYKKMKKITKILPMVLAVVFGIAVFYGMAHAGFGNTAGVGIQVAWWTTAQTWGSLLTIIKTFINWMLWMLSLIALVVCLYGGFNMVTAAGDEAKYKSGFKILQQAAVGLAIIGLSWIIVSFIFFLITSGTGTTWTGWAIATP